MIWFLNHSACIFDVTPPYSNGSSTYNTLSWIIVSHHSDDVPVISSSFPPDIDLGNKFIQPSAEVLQLISHFDHKPTNHTKSMPAIHQRCKLCKKALKLCQSAQLAAPLQ